MRRLALSVLTACGLAILSACNSGSGVTTGNSSTIDHIIFTNGSGQANDFFVALYNPGASSPPAVQVNAEGVNGSGLAPQIVPSATFTWSAAFAPAGTPYQFGSTPNGSHKCGAPVDTPFIPVYYEPQNSITPVVLPPGQAADTVYAAGVAGLLPSGTGTSYCYYLLATQSGGSVQGSVLVVVSNSP
jgi:hypothetical protein